MSSYSKALCTQDSSTSLVFVEDRSLNLVSKHTSRRYTPNLTEVFGYRRVPVGRRNTSRIRYVPRVFLSELGFKKLCCDLQILLPSFFSRFRTPLGSKGPSPLWIWIMKLCARILRLDAGTFAFERSWTSTWRKIATSSRSPKTPTR